MVTRRRFLQLSAATLPALAFRRALGAQHIPLGVQLYTVRDLAEHDLDAVLKDIHNIGYEEVETYWSVYTHPAGELKAMIAGAGLRVPSGHFDYDGLSDKFDYAKQLGVDWIVCPMLPDSQKTSLDGFHVAAKQFNQWGKRAKDMGMRFSFHNHNYEFKDLGGTTGYDVLLRETDPDLVFLEMDCYWITQAGRDPVTMMKSLGKRVKMLHLKDRLPDFPSSQTLDDAAAHFTEVGHGTLQWKAILEQGQKQGIEHYFVEQDKSTKDPVESIRESYNYLQKITP